MQFVGSSTHSRCEWFMKTSIIKRILVISCPTEFLEFQIFVFKYSTMMNFITKR